MLLAVFVVGCGQEVVKTPVVISTIPVNGATNVAVGTPISATFNMGMNPATLTGTTFLVSGPGGVAVAGTVSFSGVTATFVPSAALSYSATYTATITTGAKNRGDVPLLAPYTWTFTTIAPAPVVISTIPVNGAKNVLVNQVLSATFSEAMTAASINAATFTVSGPSGPVAGTVTYSGVTATFAPSAPLSNSTVYTATITTGAMDVAGTPLAANYVWSFTTITPAPLVISTMPANGATNVPVGQALVANFNEAMIPASINAATFTVSGPSGAVAGTVTYSGVAATFTPATPLAYNTVYRATITTGAMDLAGTPLAANYVWSFTTITPAPLVIATIPTNGAKNVPAGQLLVAGFNEAMNPASLNAATFTVSSPSGPVTGTVTYSGLAATFTPSANLAYDTVYTATITTGATDLAGTALAANYVWSFTTITPPPVVISTIPANAATGVPVSQILSATFNEAMDCTTLASPAKTFTLSAPGGIAVAGSVSCAGAIATFTPGADLLVNTVYTAEISTAAQSPAGTPLAANYIWTFRTLPAPTPPTVISTVPANLATNVPINQALSATFSVAMAPATIDAATFTLSGPGGVAVTGTVTYVPAGSVATFKPDVNLLANTLYTATITTGAEDLQGTALAANYVWTFTTAPAIVVTPPTVTSTIPANLATNVPFNQIVSATFSKAMNPATINATTFQLTGPGTTPVAGLVAYAAVGNTLTFTPTANLAGSTLYTATITTGAEDLAGDGLVTNYVWTFTTGAVVVDVAPELVSTVPVNLATAVPLTQVVSATFSKAINPLTITSATFSVTGPGGTAVAGTLSYDAVNFIATFTPTLPLIASTTYTATVTNGVTDLAGTPLGTTGPPDPWTFTTVVVIVPPPIILGPTISLFGGFGGPAGMTNMGIETVVNGDIGTTGASTLMTGFHDTSVVMGGVDECTYTETPLNIGLVTATIETAAPPPTTFCPNEGTAATFLIASNALLEAQTAYNTLATIPNGLDVSVCPGCGGGNAGELGNRTLAAGTYKSAAGSFAITNGDLTLDAKGDPNAFWIFQMDTSLTVGTPTAHRSVLLVNGAKAGNVYWQVGSAATINGVQGGGTMSGTVISQAGIAVSTAGVNAITTINGRVLSLNASVTLVNTVINVP